MFKIGGRVIVTKNHSQGIVKKGDKFKIKDLMTTKCCGLLIADLGIKKASPITSCVCKKLFYTGDTFWINTEILSPIDDKFAEEILRKISLEIEKEIVKKRNVIYA